MGYFSNGAEGMDYQEEWCVRCVHDTNEGCAVWLAHLCYSCEQCNDPESILHILIPRTGIENDKCKMFVEIP